jgi:hypothetical protein
LLNCCINNQQSAIFASGWFFSPTRRKYLLKDKLLWGSFLLEQGVPAYLGGRVKTPATGQIIKGLHQQSTI